MDFHRILLFLGVLVTVDVSVCPGAEDRQFKFSGQLTSLKLDSDILGKGWYGPSGLIADDLADTSSLTEPAKSTADQLAKAALPKGITACADFTYTRKDKPRIVTLRVFVFKHQENALAWWKEKYESPAAKNLYRAVAGYGDRAFDSVQLPKRIVLVGNCLLTCHQLHGGTEYETVLDAYLKRLTGTAKTDHNRPPQSPASPRPLR